MILKQPKAIFDEVYHTDRIEVDKNGKPISIISVKPESFSSNALQYKDVFAGLQYMSDINSMPWKIYYRNGSFFSLISFENLSVSNQIKVKDLANNYQR